MINSKSYQKSDDDNFSNKSGYNNELPDYLLNVGWGKFWSKRENRTYYYNKNTGVSLWDYSELLHYHAQQSHKRKSCELNLNNNSNLIKRTSLEYPHAKLGPSFLPGSLYDFSEYTNSQLFILGKRPPISVFLPPHPIIELDRSHFLSRLRAQFINSCESRENIIPPEGSFNRWLLQMKINDSGYDPLFPTKCPVEIGVSMKRELLLSLPFPLIKPKYLNAAKAQLIHYAEAVKDMVEKRTASPPCRKIIKHNVEETMRWIKREEYRSFYDYVEKLANLKRICQPHIQELARESIERICKKMFSLSQEYAHHIRVKHLKLLQQSGISSIPQILLQEPLNQVSHVVHNPLDNNELDLCDENLLWPRHKYQQNPNSSSSMSDPSGSNGNIQYYPPHSLGFACACPLFASPSTQPQAEITEEHNTDLNLSLVTVEIPNLGRFQLSRSHFIKLEHLYLLNTKEDPSKIAFNCRLWCLLQRYFSYLGCENGSIVGSINQAALPVSVFEALHRLFDVNFELFASPINCYFAKYCSAFHDTDQYFGSCGPFLEFFPVSGSYEANPPFCEELLLSLVRHVEKLLECSKLPLSFIIFIPDWRDPPFEALTLLEGSSYKRSQITLRAREHEYRIANFPPSNISSSPAVVPSHGASTTSAAVVNHDNISASGPSVNTDVKTTPPTVNPIEPEILKRSGHNTLVVFLQNDAGYNKWTPTPGRLKELISIYNSTSVFNSIPTRRDLDEEYVNSIT